MADDQIFVDGELFLARAEEQNQFRQALRKTLSAEQTEDSPYIFIIQGPSGMGKSKLLRRLRDIAARESPFEATTHTMLVDLESDWKSPPKISKDQVDLTQVSEVFSFLYQAARDAGWGHQFSEYQAALRQLNRAEKKFIEAVDQEAWGHQYAALRWLDPSGLARLIRLQDIPQTYKIGQGGVNLRQLAEANGLDIEAIRQVRTWLSEQIHFEEEEGEVFVTPNTVFAERLALGFSRIAQTKPLVILFDSYEKIADGDPWVREAIADASSRVVWVLASSENLMEINQPKWSAGFGEQFKENVRPTDLQPLSEDHVSAYLFSRAPDRLVTRSSVELIYNMTQGIPLGVQLSGDLWAAGVPVHEITHGIGKNSSPDEVLETLSQRFVDYCGDLNDRQALVYLAIQPRPNPAILADVLQPGKGSFELRERLRKLATRYNSVQVNGGVKLHQKVKEALSRYLIRRRIRVSEEVKAIASKAAEALDKIRAQLETSMPRLEDRFESAEWLEVMLDGLHWKLLDNEFNAWRQLTRDFVDALGYDQPVARAQVAVIEQVEGILSKNGRQRFRVYQNCIRSIHPDPASPADSPANPDRELENFAELERWISRYGDKEIFASERRAILDIRRGDLLITRRRYDEALNYLLKAEKNIPPGGESLTRQLALLFEQIGEKLAWRVQGTQILEALPSPSAETSLKKAIALGNRKARTYHTLGAVQEKLGKLEAALENLLQTVTLNPENMLAWHDLGNVYRKQELYEKAIPAYRRSIEIEPNNFQARLYLAVCYRSLKDRDKFNQELDSIKDMARQENEFNRACLEALTLQIKPALSLLEVAIQKNQVSRNRLMQDPCLDSLRNSQDFQSLIQTSVS